MIKDSSLDEESESALGGIGVNSKNNDGQNTASDITGLLGKVKDVNSKRKSDLGEEQDTDYENNDAQNLDEEDILNQAYCYIDEDGSRHLKDEADEYEMSEYEEELDIDENFDDEDNLSQDQEFSDSHLQESQILQQDINNEIIDERKENSVEFSAYKDDKERSATKKLEENSRNVNYHPSDIQNQNNFEGQISALQQEREKGDYFSFNSDRENKINEAKIGQNHYDENNGFKDVDENYSEKYDDKDEDEDESGDGFSDSSDSSGGSGFKEESSQKYEDNEEQDSDQRSISNNLKLEELLAGMEEEMREVEESLEGILPESNQQRNLDREVGGLEREEDDRKAVKDVWDERGEEVSQMGEDNFEDLIDASTSTLRQSYLHRQKQEKKRSKKNIEQAEEAIEDHEHSKRVQEERQKDSNSSRLR